MALNFPRITVTANMLLFTLILVGLSNYISSQVIGPHDFGARLAKSMNSKLNGNQYMIQNLSHATKIGSIECKEGNITDLQIDYVDVRMFPQEDKLEFTFVTSNFTTVFPFVVKVDELRAEGTLTFYVTHYELMILYRIVNDRGDCSVNAVHIALRYVDSVELGLQYSSAMKISEKTIRSMLSPFGTGVFLPVLRRNVVKLLHGIADDSIYEIITSTFGAHGYKNCKRYVVKDTL